MNNPPTSPIPSTPPAHKPSYSYTRADRILAVLLWVVGYLFCSVLPILTHPLPAFLLEMLLFIGTTVGLVTDRRRRGDSPMPRAISCAIVATSLLSALSLLLTTNRAIMTCTFIWNGFAWFYLVFVLTDNARERVPGGHFVGELLTATVVMPFRAPGSLFGALFGTRRNPDGTPCARGRSGAILGWSCLGLVLAVVPTLVIGLLLSYDKGFSSIMDTILDNIFSADAVFRQLRNILVGMPVGALLFGALLAGRLKRRPPKKEASVTTPGMASPTRSDGAHILPVALVAAMLTPILILYVIFFISQWEYYVSAFTGVRPEELTYATYAREGFFQLVAVTVINALLGLGTATLSVRRPADAARPRRNRTSPVLRGYLIALSLFTLVLIATALSKMYLYVRTYGMTQKRIYATWLMLLLAVAFVAVILRQLWARMNLVGTLLAVFLVFFMAISVVNVDSLILSYNVHAALDGNLRAVQGDVFEDAGLSGVCPALTFMAETADAALTPSDTPATESTAASPTADDIHAQKLTATRAAIHDYLTRMAEELDGMKWHEHNAVTLRARAALEQAGY